jgi:hypothetical protein
MQPATDYLHVMLLDVTTEPHTLLTDVREILSHFPAFFRPIWTKFGTRDVLRYLLSLMSCEFTENRSRDGRTFLRPLNKITFKRIPSKHFIFVISNEHFGKICVLRHEVHHLSIFYHHMTCYCYDYQIPEATNIHLNSH